MQKQLSKKRSLLRPADGLLPLSLLVAALAGGEEALRVYKYALVSALLALGTSVGLRRAFSAQPSMRKVRGSVAVALALQPLGGALALAAAYLKNGGLPPASLWYATAAVFLNAEQVFHEYLYAAGAQRDAAITRSLTAALLLAALLLRDCRYIAAAAGAGVAIAASAGLARGGPLKGKLNPQVLRAAPAAMLQLGLYPAAYAALRRVPELPLHSAATSAPLLAGLVLWTLSRSPFRRSALEARPFYRAMLAVLAGAVAALALWRVPAVSEAVTARVPIAAEIPAVGVSLALAVVCAVVMYGNFERRKG